MKEVNIPQNSPERTANSLNTYFLTIVEKLNNSTKTPRKEEVIQYMTKTVPRTIPNISLAYICKLNRNIINSLKSKNLCSLDEISAKLLKTCSDYISVPLSYLCNHSFTEGTLPEGLKYSEVKPPYKKGEKSCISNYRTVSLLTFSNDNF
jgi:hypothetical protein